MRSPSRASFLHRAIFAFLCISSVGLQGCGLGWLYLRIGDSHRIRGAKILEYDTTEKRFKNAQEAYKRAIDYYRDSLLYDQTGNMDVYHKSGNTFLQLSPPDLDRAKEQFETGIKLKREKADKESKTDQLNSTPDEDFSQMNAGMGTVSFYKAIATKRDELYDEALKYYAIAEGTSTHPGARRSGLFDRVLDYMNLNEILTPVPPRVLAARVHLYRAKKQQERGHADRAKIDLASAKEAIEDTLVTYPDDSRAKAELARYHFLKGEFEECVKVLDSLDGKASYADAVENNILKARALVETNKPDKAIPIFTEIHDRFVSVGVQSESKDEGKTLRDAIKKRDSNTKETQDASNLEVDESAERDPTNIQAMVGRAHAYAAKGDLQNATSDVDYYLRIDPKDPRLYMEAGKVYMRLKSYDSAVSRLLKGYYIDPKDIGINFALGKAYEAAGRLPEAKDCFARVVQLDPTSSYAADARAYFK